MSHVLIIGAGLAGMSAAAHLSKEGYAVTVLEAHPYIGGRTASWIASDGMPIMPAVTFQIELDKPGMEVDRTTFGPQTILASFAEQSRTTFKSTKGRLSVILARPGSYISTPADVIMEEIARDMARLGLPIAGSVVRCHKVTLPHDFYSLRTGSEVLRPAQKTPVPGLTLAGDYTKQPYLATMEGAVVSGARAAAVVREELRA